MKQIISGRQVKFNANKTPLNKKVVKFNLTMYETFGQWLKEKRVEAGFSQTELARRARTTKATISLLESDKIEQPRFDKLDGLEKDADD